MSNNVQFPVLETTSEPTAAERHRAMRVASTIVMPASLLSAAPAGLIKRIGRVVASKLGLMVTVSVITQFIIKPDAFWHFFKLVCAIIGMAGDEKVTRGITTLFQSGKEVVKQQAEPSDGEQPKPTIRERAKNFGNKVKEETKQAVQDTSDKIEQKSKPLADKADRAFSRIAGEGLPPSSSPNQIVAGGNAPLELNQGDAALGRHQIVGDGQVITRQKMAGLIPPNAPPPGMMDQVKIGARAVGNGVQGLGNAYVNWRANAAEEQRLYLEWYATNCPYNGSCTRGHGMKIPTHATKPHLCSACNLSYPARTILRLGPPRPPLNKPAAFYRWAEQRKEPEPKEAR